MGAARMGDAFMRAACMCAATLVAKVTYKRCRVGGENWGRLAPDVIIMGGLGWRTQLGCAFRVLEIDLIHSVESD